MKAGWKAVKIGQISDIAYGYTEKASFEEIGPKFLRITDIQDGGVNWATVPYCQVNPREHQRHRLHSGDIVFARTGATTGKSYLITDPPNAVCASYLIRLRLKGGDAFPEFVQHFFQTSAYWDAVEAGTTGSAQGGFNASKLAGLNIPLPSLDEQRRIVAVLGKAFAGIATATANAQQNLTNARAFFESYANDAFEELALAVVKRPALETLTEAKSGITYGVVKPGDVGRIPFVRGGDLIGGEVRLDRLRTITDEVSAQYNRTLLRGGELLMCLVGVPGQCAIAPPELAGANIARQVGLIRLRPDVNAEYVKDYLQSPPGQKSLGTFTGGSVQQVINLGDLRQIEIPLPDRSKQDEMVKRIAISKSLSCNLAKTYEAKIAALAELKQSLLQKAFAGELT